MNSTGTRKHSSIRGALNPVGKTGVFRSMSNGGSVASDSQVKDQFIDRLLFGIVGAMLSGSIAWVGANQRFVIKGSAPWEIDKPDVIHSIEQLQSQDRLIRLEIKSDLDKIKKALNTLSIDVGILNRDRGVNRKREAGI